jgi:hypothetical protein
MGGNTGKRTIRLALFFSLALFLTACAPPSWLDQPTTTDFALLDSDGALGQTFVARFDGLSGIGLQIKTQEDGEGIIKLGLRASPEAKDNLREVALPLSAINESGYTNFYFLPVPESNQKDFYFHLWLLGNGSVLVGTAPGSSYLDGAMLQAGQPMDAQLTFQTIYGPRLMLIGLIQEVLTWLFYSLAGIFLFIIPGWGTLSWSFPGWELKSFWEKTGLSTGLSLVIYPLLFLWCSVIGIRISALYTWLPALVGSGLILARNRHVFSSKFKPDWRALQPGWTDLSMGFILICITLTRYWVIRSIDYPLWGDSYQHTMMAQLLVDHQGLFKSWAPYAEMQSFTYHFGFHSLVAVFHWLTKLPVIQAVLWVGQILNVLAVLALYPLSQRVARNPWAGVFTVLLAGLVFSMPMFYVNWGRYTQLAGLAILPALIVIAWDFLDQQCLSRRLLFLITFITAGMFITHVRVLIIALVFFVAYLLLNFRANTWKNTFFRGAAIGVGTILLALPWIINLSSGKLPAIFQSQITTLPVGLAQNGSSASSIGNLFSYLPAWAWLIIPIAIGWGLWRKDKGIALISLWWYLVFLVANPQWLNLPGEGILTGFAVMISAYLPASIVLGATVSQIIQQLEIKGFVDEKQNYRFNRLTQAYLKPLLFVTVLCVSLVGMSRRFNDLQVSQHTLATRADLRAARWIKENTPENAGFLVNSFFAYNDTAIVGSDGGWWLPLIADRRTTLPPLTYASELGQRPDYREQINQLTKLIQENGIGDTEVLKEFADRHIYYVYIGQQQGSVNSTSPLIDQNEINSDPNFIPVYYRDRVWIFQIRQ